MIFFAFWRTKISACYLDVWVDLWYRSSSEHLDGNTNPFWIGSWVRRLQSQSAWSSLYIEIIYFVIPAQNYCWSFPAAVTHRKCHTGNYSLSWRIMQLGLTSSVPILTSLAAEKEAKHLCKVFIKFKLFLLNDLEAILRDFSLIRKWSLWILIQKCLFGVFIDSASTWRRLRSEVNIDDRKRV